MVEQLAYFTKGYFIDGTAIIEVEPAHHGSDFHTHVADVSDKDWELVVLALRMQDRMAEDAKAWVKAQEKTAASHSDEELAKRLLWNNKDEYVIKEAAKRLKEKKNGGTENRNEER